VKPYKAFRPTVYDHAGLEAVGQNRDSKPLEQSNFAVALELLGGESETVEVHRFGHWGPGWFEIILIDPGAADKIAIAQEIEERMENYPVLDEQDLSRREMDEANEIWRQCYRPKERLEYIRRYRSQFEFSSLADVLGCVRGRYFAGYASELVNR
jgi:hypothetical protein